MRSGGFPALKFVLFIGSLSCAAPIGCADKDESGATHAPQVARPTFNKDVAPIIFEHCAVCHRPGESAPFSLLSYRDVKKRAGQIAKVTADRYMPPWLPEPGFGRFVGQRRLSESQVDAIGRWVAQGAVQGDPSDLPPTPQPTSGWQIGEPDLVVQMPAPYVLPPQGANVFRNFVIGVPVNQHRYVKAVELRPGNKKIVHHAVMQIDRTSYSRRLAERDLCGEQRRAL